MAWELDEESEVYVNADDGSVWDAEDGEFLGDVNSFYGLDGDDEDLEPADLEPADVSAIYEAAREDYASALADLRTEIADMREAQAIHDGYSLARQEDAAELAEAEADEADWENSLNSLANKLNRPLSETEAARMEALLPDYYSDEDVERAARDAGIESFNAPGARGREARAAYMTARLGEIEAAADANYDAGGYDEVNDGGGISALIASAEANGGN